MSLFSKKEKPVFREIFLSDENRKLRVILLCVFLGIGVVAIAAGLMDFLSVDPGWQEVEVIADGVNCSKDFTFQYYFTDSGASATVVQKDLISMYSDAAEKAYWLFTPDQETQEYTNVYTINHNMNTEIVVDPVLYDAFALMEQYGSRNLYLGPVYRQYENIFLSTDDGQAEYWDPDRDEDSAQYVSQLAAFARDENAISLELLGDNKVMLKVSEAYRSFAEENEIENFIDFGWMRNAFIIDYFADLCLEKGYTKGFFVSVDGFTRNLNSGTSFSFNLLNKVENTIYPAGVMEYDVPLSIVYLHNYPITRETSARYYTYGDGAITSGYVDIRSGLDLAAANDQVSYSENLGCAEVLLQIAPVYIADSLETEKLTGLAVEGIQSIWYEDFLICYTEETLQLNDILRDEQVTYTSRLVK